MRDVSCDDFSTIEHLEKQKNHHWHVFVTEQSTGTATE